MSNSKATIREIDLSDPRYYFNRELSWIEFNRRVLHEAFDKQIPLLERLKFLAIFSSNLDEFFMVRVSTLKEEVETQNNHRTPDGRTAQMQIDEIDQVLRPIVIQQQHFFEQKLRPKLAKEGIFLLNYSDLSKEQRSYLQSFFDRQIFPVLTPLAVDPTHPFPTLSNLSLNLAIVVQDPETQENYFARVKVPDQLPRFIELPKATWHAPESHWIGIPLEQVIIHHLDAVFPGMLIQECCVFRVTRDGDFPIREEEADDLLIAVQTEVSKRRFHGHVIRLEIQATAPKFVRETLIRGLDLSESDIYDLEGLLNLKDLMSVVALPLPTLKDPEWTPVTPPRLKSVQEEEIDIFTVIRDRDLLIHHPYECFTASVQEFITQAAHDPSVLAIKMTLYRTSGDSPIVQALIDAAKNRKQVVALIELKARFDEENNINWANKLDAAGVHVVYGILGLKTHTKVILVVRQEGDQIRRYVHVGTGNYNRKTAKLYTDVGLLSCRDEIGADLTDLFNYLTGYSRQQSYRKLLVAPLNIRSQKPCLIQQEIKHANHHRPARIIAKMNALVDPAMIRALYEASQAGVEIDLIVRGSCCLRPGLEGVSNKIRVISIIGRYLEHSRIFYFHNAGQPELLIGSADWMPRNLDKRVEAIVPVEDKAIQQQLITILDILLSDNCKAWELRSTGEYVQRHPKQETKDSQKILMEQARLATRKADDS